MRLGKKGMGFLSVWINIIVSIFIVSILVITFSNFVKTDALTMITAGTEADTILRNTIIPIWDMLPWGYAFAIIAFGIYARPWERESQYY